MLPIEGTKPCQTFGKAAIRLYLCRKIGEGSTGTVYIVQVPRNVEAGQFAVKIASIARKGDEKKEARLFNEFRVYLRIETARRTTNVKYAVPICYGYYESESHETYALITRFEGPCLRGLDLRYCMLTDKDKLVIFLFAGSL